MRTMVIYRTFNALLQAKDKKKVKSVRNSNDIAFRGFMDHLRGIKINFYRNEYTWDNSRMGRQMI